MFDIRYQVKQYIAEIHGKYSGFRVFKTGDEKYYLFSQIKNGCDTGLHFPVEKNRLRNDVKRALLHGWGYTYHENRKRRQFRC